jgi:hypothetical protein
MQAHLAVQRACDAAGDVLVLEMKLKRPHQSSSSTKRLSQQKHRKKEQVRKHLMKSFQWVSHGQKLSQHVPPADRQHGLVDNRRLLALQPAWEEVGEQTVQEAARDLTAIGAAHCRIQSTRSRMQAHFYSSC